MNLLFRICIFATFITILHGVNFNKVLTKQAKKNDSLLKDIISKIQKYRSIYKLFYGNSIALSKDTRYYPGDYDHFLPSPSDDQCTACGVSMKIAFKIAIM